MEKTNQLQAVETEEVKPKKKFHFPVAKAAYYAFTGLTCAMLGMMFCAQPAFAASTTTVWTKANEIMKDVYSQILLISTIAAVVTASVALLMMNFSRSGRTVDVGDGVDMDMFLSREPKEQIVQTVGRQLRINRSKIKDATIPIRISMTSTVPSAAAIT